jgi:LysM repeat protein
MNYTVRSGDSLSSIARRLMGDADRWPQIARLNGLSRPDLLLVGQTLRMPGAPPPTRGPSAAPGRRLPERHPGTQTSLVPAQWRLFVLADEVNPLRTKVVRRVIVNDRMAAQVASRIGRPVRIFPNPEIWGFQPSGPANSPVTVGRHVQGHPNSPFVSASRAWPTGARRFAGTPFWIDEARARAAGATIHDTDEIVAGLRDILRRTKDPASRLKLEELIRKVPSDREVLLRGPVPASAIKGPLGMGVTRGLQGVQIIGFAMTAYDMGHAAQKSQRTHSMRPLAAETLRQAGGWGAAWAGAKLGALGGAAVGVETGPGALVTGLIGGVVGGVAGYYGADWIADHIDEN